MFYSPVLCNCCITTTCISVAQHAIWLLQSSPCRRAVWLPLQMMSNGDQMTEAPVLIGWCRGAGNGWKRSRAGMGLLWVTSHLRWWQHAVGKACCRLSLVQNAAARQLREQSRYSVGQHKHVCVNLGDKPAHGCALASMCWHLGQQHQVRLAELSQCGGLGGWRTSLGRVGCQGAALGLDPNLQPGRPKSGLLDFGGTDLCCPNWTAAVLPRKEELIPLAPDSIAARPTLVWIWSSPVRLPIPVWG